MAQQRGRTAPEKQEYRLGYEHAGMYQEALAKAGGDPDGVDPADFYEYEYVATLEEAERRAQALASEHDTTVTICRYADMELVEEEEWPYIAWWHGIDPVEVACVSWEGVIERFD